MKSLVEEPATYQKVIKTNILRKAMKNEMMALMQNQTW